MQKTMDAVHSKAPGKILLFGGYAVLEQGNFGYAISTDAHVHAYAKIEPGMSVKIEAPQFGSKAVGSINRDTGQIDFSPYPPEMHLAATAAQVAVSFASGTGHTLHGFALRTENDDAFAYKLGGNGQARSKSGLGSSAAVTVAITSSVMFMQGVDIWEHDALHKASQFAHAHATEKVGSGFDIATATYGDQLYSRYNPKFVTGMSKDFSKDDVAHLIRQEWDYRIVNHRLPSLFTVAFGNFEGRAAITKSMVKSVNEFKQRDRGRYDSLVEELNFYDGVAVSALMRACEGIDVEKNKRTYAEATAEIRKISKELGRRSNIEIEPDPATKLIMDTIAAGAFDARLSGAGGYDNIVALLLDNGDINKTVDNINKLWEANGVTPTKISRNGSGVVVEPMESSEIARLQRSSPAA